MDLCRFKSCQSQKTPDYLALNWTLTIVKLGPGLWLSKEASFLLDFY